MVIIEKVKVNFFAKLVKIKKGVSVKVVVVFVFIDDMDDEFKVVFSRFLFIVLLEGGVEGKIEIKIRIVRGKVKVVSWFIK